MIESDKYRDLAVTLTEQVRTALAKYIGIPALDLRRRRGRLRRRMVKTIAQQFTLPGVSKVERVKLPRKLKKAHKKAGIVDLRVTYQLPPLHYISYTIGRVEP